VTSRDLPQIEILYFEGCPNHEEAQALVERVAAEFQLDTTPNLVEVPDAETATTMRFSRLPECACERP
jgi:hypothetical protein